MSAESVRAAAARGVMALNHMLTCRDIERVFGPMARAGDAEAAALVQAAADHMRELGMPEQPQSE